MAKSFRELKIWQLAHELMLGIYKLTENFPSSEKYNLTQQLRRAALSVPTNIAEAHGRFHYADSNNFLINARGSAQEVRSLLSACKDLQKIGLPEELFSQLDQKYEGLVKGINAFINANRKLANR